MKRLHAEDEMCKENEPSRQTPSIVAKLMGLDRIPHQQGGDRKPKNASHGSNGKTVPFGGCKCRQSCSDQSCRTIAGQRRFKDVYEVRSSQGRLEDYRFQVCADRRHRENEMAFVRQKFMDAKGLSGEKRLRGSKECHDTIEALTSNNRLFLKFLQEPDLLYAMRLHDLQQVSDKCVGFPSGGKEATSTVPTKVVLLKPNLGRSHKTAKSCSSFGSFHELLPDAGLCKNKQMHARHGAPEVGDNKRLSIELDFSAHKSRESRALAKDITRQMRSKLGEVSSKAPSSRYRRFSADHISDYDSYYERGAAVQASQTRNRSPCQRKSSSLQYAETSVSREGKKRLSERWKMTHKSAEIRTDKCTTLREMLSTPDIDDWPANVDVDLAENESSRPAERLGANIKDEGHDGCRSLSQSTSLPSSGDLIENPGSHIKQLVSRKGDGHARKKAVNRDLSLTEGSSHGDRRVRDRKRRSSHHMSVRTANDEQDEQLAWNGKMSILQEKDSPELKTVILETPTCLLDTSLNRQSVMDVDHENDSASLSSYNDLFPAAELPIEVQVKCHSTCIGIHESAAQITVQPQEPSILENDGLQPRLQNFVAQSESPVSSKETDQPSPVSVLEAPFSEDALLDSECFERVSTKLHGLRKQLQLLRLESEASIDQGEANFLISSDNNEEKSVSRNPTVAESLIQEASYTSDVLAELGLEHTKPNQVGPSWVFEKLERKYNGQGDKCGLMEFTQGSMGLYPWVKTSHCSSTGTRFTATEEVLQSDLQWMDAVVYIDGIGSELGKMMLDEIIFESLMM